MPNFALRRSDFTIKDGDVSNIAGKVEAVPKDVLSALKRLEDKGYVVYKSEEADNTNNPLTPFGKEEQRLYVAPLALRRLTGELELHIVSLLLGYQLTECARIVRNSKEAEPLIVGSNVPVSRIAAYFESGKTMEEIQEDFQDLMEDDFMDALRYYMHHRKEMINEVKEYLTYSRTP
jgi:uncharacterized protein (DUF433 family)/DNA-binding MarR family transcriptional regulator